MVVPDIMRTNYLSVIPGGYTVLIRLSGNEDRIYDKVKNPMVYIKTVLENSDNIKSVWLAGGNSWVLIWEITKGWINNG